MLENALATLHTDAIIGDFHVDAPETGRASVLGAALQQWLAAVLAAPGLQPSQKRRR